MFVPSRIRSALVVSGLARFEAISWSAADAPLAAAFDARVASSPRRAHALVAARIELLRPATSSQPAEAGARLYARWLRGADATTRARVARALSAEDQAHVAALAVGCPPFEVAQQAVVTWMIATGMRALGRMPSVAATAALVALIAADRDCDDLAVLRWERALRVGGRQAACVRVAAELRAS